MRCYLKISGGKTMSQQNGSASSELSLEKSTRFQGLGSEGFILNSLKEFWDKESISDNYMTSVGNFALMPERFWKMISVLGLIGGVIGAIVGNYYDSMAGMKVGALFGGMIGAVIGLPTYGILARIEKKRLESESSHEINSFVASKVSKFQLGTDFDRAEMILEWLQDQKHGLIVNLINLKEAARGESSGYAANEKAKFQDAVDSLDKLLQTAYENNRQDQIEEIKGMLKNAKDKLNGIKTSKEVKALQRKLEQAETRVEVVQGIATTLKTQVPFDKEMDKFRKMFNSDEYNSANAPTAANQIMASAMSKLEEVITHSENLQLDIASELPDIKFQTMLPKSPVEKAIGA